MYPLENPLVGPTAELLDAVECPGSKTGTPGSLMERALTLGRRWEAERARTARLVQAVEHMLGQPNGGDAFAWTESIQVVIEALKEITGAAARGLNPPLSTCGRCGHTTAEHVEGANLGCDHGGCWCNGFVASKV